MGCLTLRENSRPSIRLLSRASLGTCVLLPGQHMVEVQRTLLVRLP